MMNVVFILCVVFFNQLCQADKAADAEGALNSLRNVTIINLNAAYDQHVKIASEVDIVSLDTKSSALKTLTETTPHCRQFFVGLIADELVECVDQEAIVTLNTLRTQIHELIDQSLHSLYEEQKDVIGCGRADEECLNRVIMQMVDKTGTFPGFVKAAVQKSLEFGEQQIEIIKGCAGKAVEKGAGFAQQC